MRAAAALRRRNEEIRAEVDRLNREARERGLPIRHYSRKSRVRI